MPAQPDQPDQPGQPPSPTRATQKALDQSAKHLAYLRLIRDRRTKSPMDWYEPHVLGQRQFHLSRHKYRVLVPGNGWGKTRAMGSEAQWWATHTHPFQPTPLDRRILMLWFCKLQDQFELLRVQLEEDCFGLGPRWKSGHYEWPNGSIMYLGSADRQEDWKKWQGVALDLCMFDEQPPRRLWQEMTMRRRAKRKTRYVIAATATEGDSWMEKELYAPWVEYHSDIGMDEDRALEAQAHPSTFVWSKGGIADNPGADADDLAHYDEATLAMHPNERKVRMRGGFSSWTGDAVFLPESLEWLRTEAARLDKMGKGISGVLEIL